MTPRSRILRASGNVTHVAFGSASSARGQVDLAREHAEDLFERAVALEDEEKTMEAEKVYRQVLELAPDHAKAWTNLGTIAFERGDDDVGAVACFRRGLELDSTQWEAHYNLGFVLYMQADYRGAIPHFIEGLAYKHDFADAHLYLAESFERLKKRLHARVHWMAYLRHARAEDDDTRKIIASVRKKLEGEG